MATSKNRNSYRRVVKSARPLNQDSSTNKKSSGGLFGKWMIVLVCLMIIGYLVVDIVCGFMIGQFLPDVLTTSWFAFWAVELVNLVVVKRSKIRAQYPDLIEESPDSVNSFNVNLRPKEDFGNLNQSIQDVVNSGNLDNPLPVQDDIGYEEPSDDYISYNLAEGTSDSNKGGDSQCLNLIY